MVKSAVLIYKPSRILVIIPRIEVIKSEVCVVVIATVGERVKYCVGEVTCVMVAYLEVTPSIVEVFEILRSVKRLFSDRPQMP